MSIVTELALDAKKPKSNEVMFPERGVVDREKVADRERKDALFMKNVESDFAILLKRLKAETRMKPVGKWTVYDTPEMERMPNATSKTIQVYGWGGPETWWAFDIETRRFFTSPSHWTTNTRISNEKVFWQRLTSKILKRRG